MKISNFNTIYNFQSMVKRKVPEPSSREILTTLTKRLSGSLCNEFLGQQENVDYLLDMFNRTVDKGESNSLLVLGPRGVGKTRLVDHVLETAMTKKTWRDNVVVVKLSGYIQIDDKLALRDITKQLNLENVVGDKVFGSFAEHLSFLLASLKTGDTTSKPIIFILDHFESFCSHKNQTLLYNLFDVAQSRAVPITVLGVSSSIDVTELLEKRVKSRFSHRHLYIWPINKLDKYLETADWLLRLPEPDFANWNKSLSTFMETKAVKKLINERIYSANNSVRDLKQTLLMAGVSMVQSGDSQLSLQHLEQAIDMGGNFEVVKFSKMIPFTISFELDQQPD